MNTTFDALYRQLGRATFGLLMATFASYGITLLFAVLGLSRGVISFRGVTASLAYASVALLAVFLVASVASAFIRWVDRPH